MSQKLLPALRDISQAQPALAGARLGLIFDLADLAGIVDVAAVTWRAQIRPAAGHPVVLYEWKSGGSAAFPASETSVDPAGSKIRLGAASIETRTYFSALLQAEYPSPWRIELGFYRPEAPDDFVAIGVGDFPVSPGVVA